MSPKHLIIVSNLIKVHDFGSIIMKQILCLWGFYIILDGNGALFKNEKSY